MKILFLHGWHSVPGGVKPTYLKDHGHEVINPALDDDDFDAAVQTAQAEFNKHNPDVIVGSSRGGAVAMNLNCGETPLVLLCPAWKKYGTATSVKAGTTILHSRADDVVQFSDSKELVSNSGLPTSALIEVGYDHRLADIESLANMSEACWDDRYHAIHESSHAVVALRRRLTPRNISILRTGEGSYGAVRLCSVAALQRDSCRWLLFLVAGNVGTRLLGYSNRLMSEKLACLADSEEPLHGSDEWHVWDDGNTQAEIQAAESKARQILERDNTLLNTLAEALIAKRELNKDEILAVVAECRQKQ